MEIFCCPHLPLVLFCAQLSVNSTILQEICMWPLHPRITIKLSVSVRKFETKSIPCSTSFCGWRPKHYLISVRDIISWSYIDSTMQIQPCFVQCVPYKKSYSNDYPLVLTAPCLCATQLRWRCLPTKVRPCPRVRLLNDVREKEEEHLQKSSSTHKTPQKWSEQLEICRDVKEAEDRSKEKERESKLSKIHCNYLLSHMLYLYTISFGDDDDDFITLLIKHRPWSLYTLAHKRSLFTVLRRRFLQYWRARERDPCCRIKEHL